ncbi:pectin acetylesterase [Paenibacillus sp. E222]|uniref:pectin acetylesterase-family hydrolase n=1 Tax=Paenibacillus sp. E222 TaxID=2748863 RepID=UPI0015C607A1|nr:pectin acetylesterase-family hydrolase [Paenibacillus sp. E222]QLG40510.1 pectin acetylesterase [Paenibacillus sp. E222]
MFDNVEEYKKYLQEHQLPVLEGVPDKGQWYRVPVPGAICAGGSPYWGYLRKGTEPGLIVFFLGGGVSLNAYTAARPTRLGAQEENFYVDDKALQFNDLAFNRGIFDETPDNPFRNWSFIFVSYATGDFHVGNGDYHYTARDGSPAVLHHHGYSNYSGLMEQATKHLSTPTKLLITGTSGGAFGAAALTSDVMSYFPECRDVTCCPDSALLLNDQWKTIAQNIWQASERIWEPLQGPNICLDWMRTLYAEKGNDVRYLYINSIRDTAFAMYQHYIDHGTLEVKREQCLQFEKDLKEMVDALKSEIPGIGIFLFDNPIGEMYSESMGTTHTLIHDPEFYRPVKHGTSLRDWLWSAVNGNVYDAGLDLLEG